MADQEAGPAAGSAVENVVFRPMSVADVPAVLALERELFPTDAWPEQFFHDELAHAGSAADGASRRYWVGEDSRAPGIVAYAGMMYVPPLADVQTLAVAPVAQGRGLGTHLLELIEAEARQRGAQDLLLEVREDNPGAQRLYLRCGFEQIHRRRNYYPDGGEALIMRKHLQDPQPSTAANLRAG